ncbi:hypothetical protein Nepgr_001461 [Nepenthes gracilis]|uniref:NTF2-like domain-containing protein n=1 Tax=Nepenthes gracilis TaxID=150966 RepID=A0AAD3P583_NEPGR|nr:hypothetical protein Nepgr_001461 [Nepenthes gracilis]
MAGICCYIGASSKICFHSRQIHKIRCCSNPRNSSGKGSPQLLKLAVSGVTEILRLFSFRSNSRGNTMNYDKKDGLSISSIEDVVNVLKLDFENAYFVTGIFTSEIYAEDCIFEDPTIKFSGTVLYSRNLQLLVPFFDQPSIVLQKMEKGVNCERNFVSATWRVRTYLKLPWRPLIIIDGSTVYDLDDEFKITRHSERWNVSAVEAIGQIFTPSSARPND